LNDQVTPVATGAHEHDQHAEHHLELTLEASTMALYVSVVLLAALVALEDGVTTADREMLGLIWGTTIGLALAHYFAFRVASRLVRGTTFHKRDGEIALAQLTGAAIVAALCTVPVVLLPDSSKNDYVRFELAILLGIAGYAAGRTGGATRVRSLVTGLIVLVLGVGVAFVKNALIGH
jgi:hypothetical protein